MAVIVVKDGFSLDPTALPSDPFVLNPISPQEYRLILADDARWRLLDADGDATAAVGLPTEGGFEQASGAGGEGGSFVARDLAISATDLRDAFETGDAEAVLSLLLASDDVILGSDASDWLFGGAGDDDIRPFASPAAGLTVAEAATQGVDADMIDGGDGVDRVSLDLSGADYAAFGAVVAVDADGVATVKSGAPEAATAYVLHNVESLKLIGSTDDNVIQGLIGDDIIDLSGAAGFGAVNAGDGNDLVVGGAGRNNLRGDAGDDRLIGLGGRDVLVGGDGADVLRGSTGDDAVFGGDGNDRIYGGDDDDTLNGDADDDFIHGGDGDDLITGGVGQDRLFGGLGADGLFGGGDEDRMRGGAGDDTLAGGDGDDTLIGDAGADRFVLAPDHGFDRILDFQPGVDRIDLTDFGTSFGPSALALASDAPSGAVIRLPTGEGLVLIGVATAELAETDFLTGLA